IVYVGRRHTAEALADLLRSRGHTAVAYHGGMDAGARRDAQRRFLSGRARVAVATVAFGLGIDKPDIR
ncbi:unnamed protein product, partial [Heterosigma akashiwo]